VRRFFSGLLFAILAMLIAESVTSEDTEAQRTPPQMITDLRPGWQEVVLEYPSPPVYEQWWREIATCERLPLPPRHVLVRFFAVNGREFVILNDPFTSPWESPRWAIGYADPWEDEIYLAFPYLLEEMIVKHEMLHQLMKWAGEEPGHPESRYGKKDIGMCNVVPYRRNFIDDK
jgi:hypothetical protein